MPDDGGHAKDTVSMLVQEIEAKAKRLLEATRFEGVMSAHLAWREACRSILTPLIEETEDEDA